VELCQTSGLAGLGVARTAGGEKRPSSRQGITCVHWAQGDLKTAGGSVVTPSARQNWDCLDCIVRRRATQSDAHLRSLGGGRLKGVALVRYDDAKLRGKVLRQLFDQVVCGNADWKLTGELPAAGRRYASCTITFPCLEVLTGTGHSKAAQPATTSVWQGLSWIRGGLGVALQAVHDTMSTRRRWRRHDAVSFLLTSCKRNETWIDPGCAQQTCVCSAGIEVLSECMATGMNSRSAVPTDAPMSDTVKIAVESQVCLHKPSWVAAQAQHSGMAVRLGGIPSAQSRNAAVQCDWRVEKMQLPREGSVRIEHNPDILGYEEIWQGTGPTLPAAAMVIWSDCGSSAGRSNLS